MRCKGEDKFDMKRRRMPYVAKIKRDDPFRAADRREIEAMVRRIAAAGETFSIAGWRDEAGFLPFHFSTWAKAGAMQHWIDRSGIAHRPMPAPFNGPQLRLGDGAMPPLDPHPSE
jgi:hypothetical protein